ncbi:MAG: aminodeoxychorismate lyase [Verrucomicrobiota bacterium]|jgi:aminodeoxychorismate lyase|nr:aminodeoxychorismate lyase [Verrucomicrobiota bacterium]MDP7050390.1 aminodeoxychorismate lyase [Verrucomicrobiota bacterium]
MPTTFSSTSLNGRFLPLDEAKISASDRGFLYGDGLFETIRIHAGRPFLWDWHMTRFTDGSELLRIPLPQATDSLLNMVRELVARNDGPESVVRIALSRGVGQRGYGVSGNEQPTLIITQHPLPNTLSSPLSLVTTTARVTVGNPLAGVKSANKLDSILAKREASEQGADDGLILNSDGHITETSSTNLFWMENGVLHTPPISDGVLPGVTRKLVLTLAPPLGQAVREESAVPERLQQAEAVFVTSATTGVTAVGQMDGTSLGTHPLVAQLQNALEAELVRHAADPG